MSATTSKLRDRIAKLEAIAGDERAPANERSACAGIAATLRKLLADPGPQPQPPPRDGPASQPSASRVWADYDGILIMLLVDGQPLYARAQRVDIHHEREEYRQHNFGEDDGRIHRTRRPSATMRVTLDAADAAIVESFAKLSERHCVPMSISVISETVYVRATVVQQSEAEFSGSTYGPWTATLTFCVLDQQVSVAFAKALPPTRPALPEGHG